MPSITDDPYLLDDRALSPIRGDTTISSASTIEKPDGPLVSPIRGDTSAVHIPEIVIKPGLTQGGTPDEIVPGIVRSSQPELGSSLSYSSILSIDARIVGLSDGIVEMECLIDPEEGIIEVREFDSVDVEGIVPLEYHQYVYIRVLRSPGRVVHTFSNGDYRRNVVSKLFEPVDPFDELSSESFNDPVEW